MKASGGKSTLQLAASEEVVMLLQPRAGAKLLLLLHVGVVMLPPQTLTGTMRMHWRGPPRTMMLMGTAWIQLQEEETQEAVVMVSEM